MGKPGGGVAGQGTARENVRLVAKGQLAQRLVVEGEMEVEGSGGVGLQLRLDVGGIAVVAGHFEAENAAFFGEQGLNIRGSVFGGPDAIAGRIDHGVGIGAVVEEEFDDVPVFAGDGSAEDGAGRGDGLGEGGVGTLGEEVFDGWKVTGVRGGRGRCRWPESRG